MQPSLAAPPRIDDLTKDFREALAVNLSNCLAHARRKVVEVIERFPAKCEHALEELALVYRNDAQSKELALLWAPEWRQGRRRIHEPDPMRGAGEGESLRIPDCAPAERRRRQGEPRGLDALVLPRIARQQRRWLTL